MDQWYYESSGNHTGPVRVEEIKRLLDSGQLTRSTLVWSEGMPDWKAAGDLTAFTLSPYSPPASDAVSEIDWSGYVPSGPQARPWIRYWARTSDFLLFCTIVEAPAIAIFPKLAQIPDLVLGIILLPVYCFAEALLLATFGTTPFRALFKIRVRKNNGSKPDYPSALRRSFAVWIQGQGLGIPLVSLITNITSYNGLLARNVTPWDAKGGFTVSHQVIAWWRWLIWLGLVIAVTGLMGLGANTK